MFFLKKVKTKDCGTPVFIFDLNSVFVSIR